MGIRTQLNISKIHYIFEYYDIDIIKIKETKDGISDTTYICTSRENEKYILKLYESATIESVLNEIALLNKLSDLPVPKPLSKSKILLNYKNKPIALFSYLEGKSSELPTLKEIQQIGKFLGKFHNQTLSISSINPNLYTQDILKKWIDELIQLKIDNDIIQKFLVRYRVVKDFSIDEDYVIHGDLFPDNAKFVSQKLTGVFDFIESCNGDRLFDVSVVAISWCFNAQYELNIQVFKELLVSYSSSFGETISMAKIKDYMLYASFFYATQRFRTQYVEKRNVVVKEYNEYLVKFDVIQNSKF